MNKKSFFIIGCVCLLFLVVVTGIIFGVDKNEILLTFNFTVNNNQKTIKMNKGTTIDLNNYNQNFDGYEFIGWFNNSNLDYKIEDDYVFTSNNIIYAGYSKVINVNEINNLNDDNIYSYTIISDESDIITNEQIENLLKSGIKRLDLSNCRIKNNKLNNTIFRNCNLTEIILPNNILELDEYTFFNCYNLTSVELPYNLNCLNSNVFYNCPNLKNIVLKNNLKNIKVNAINNCKSLENLNLPLSVLSVESNFISNCENLRNINVDSNNEYFKSIDGVLYSKDLSNLIKCPENKNIDIVLDNVSYIFDYAFYKSKIKSIIINENIKEIGISAFEGCENLESVIIKDSDEYILKNSAFTNCKTLKSFQINQGLSIIEDNCFKNCIKLENISLYKSNVINIGNSVFEKCINLKEVTLPESLTDTGVNLFYNCENIKSVNLNSNISTLKSRMFYNCKNLEIINFNSVIKNIENYVFYNCYKLKSLNNLENVETLGDRVFYNCENLSELNLSKVKDINAFTFYNCRNLTQLNLLEIQTIKANTFVNCENLTNLVIGDKLINIEDNSFKNCYNLSLNLFNNNNFIYLDGMFLSKDKTILYWYNKTNNNTLTIPYTVNRIFNNALSGKNNLTQILVDESNLNFISIDGYLVSLKDYSLISYPSGKSNKKLVVNEQVKSLKGNSINSNYLEEIIINNTVTSIEPGSIVNVNNLKSLTLPFLGSDISHEKNDDFIGYIFYNLEDGESFNYKINTAIPTSLETVSITNDTKIGSMAFYEAANIKYINIGEKCKNIENNAFYGCSELINIYIKGEINSIGDEAFKKCITLNSISIGYDRNLTIGVDAFKGVLNKVSIYTYYSGDKRPDITAQTAYRTKFVNVYQNSRNWIFRFYQKGE